MTIKNIMTDEQIDKATQLRYDGLSWAKVGKYLGLHWQTVRDTLYPVYADSRKERKRERMRKMREGRASPIIRNMVHLEAHRVVHCPDDKLIERDQRLAVPYPDFTSEFMGDPRPGWSALDKKRAQGLWK